MLIQITALYASILTLIFLVLATRVSLLRRVSNIGVGSGEVRELELAVRVHGNFSEYVPLTILLLLLLELNGAGAAWLHAFGALLVIARILHAVGLGKSDGVNFGRFVGTAITWGLMAVGAVANFWMALGSGS